MWAAGPPPRPGRVSIHMQHESTASTGSKPGMDCSRATTSGAKNKRGKPRKTSTRTANAPSGTCSRRACRSDEMRDETAKSKGTCKIQGVACADYGGEILENRSVFRTNPLGGQADRTPVNAHQVHPSCTLSAHPMHTVGES